MGQIKMISFRIEISDKEFIKFCSDNWKDIKRLKELGFFYYKSLGAGSVRIHWNSAGQIGALKEFNWIDPPKTP